MPILDIFKKKKKKAGEKKLTKRVQPVKKIKKKERPAAEKEAREGLDREEKSIPRKKTKKTTRVYRVLDIPHVTEKATDLVKKNQYTFKVFKNTNKSEIKKAVENLYGIDVKSVKIINIPSKKRRLGRTMGRKPGYKKAIVKIAEGQKIEILPR